MRGPKRPKRRMSPRMRKGLLGIPRQQWSRTQQMLDVSSSVGAEKGRNAEKKILQILEGFRKTSKIFPRERTIKETTRKLGWSDEDLSGVDIVITFQTPSHNLEDFLIQVKGHFILPEEVKSYTKRGICFLVIKQGEIPSNKEVQERVFRIVSEFLEAKDKGRLGSSSRSQYDTPGY